MRMLRVGALVCLVTLVATEFVRADDGQADLDKALSLKLKATKLNELSEVANLCETAIKKGLDADNEQFARKLLVGSLFQRAEQLSNAMVQSALSGSGWQKLRVSALADLKKILEYNPRFAEAYLMTVRLQMLPGGDRAAANKAIAKAIELLKDGSDKETLSEALVLRGELQSDDAKRLADVNRAIELDPTNVHALESRARLYQKQGNLKKALADLRALLERQENNVTARLAVIEALANLKQYDDALNEVNMLIKKKPGSVAYALRAQLYARPGKVDAAISDCDKALKDNPSDLAARMLRAQLYYQQHRNALAAADIQYVLRARPGVPQALGLSALIHAAQGDLDKAIGLMRTVAEQDPTQIGWKLQLASLYQMAKKPRAAIAVYDKVLKTDPDQADALRGRADVRLSLGEHAEAIADYQRALKINPNDPVLLNNLAWVLATSPDATVRNGKQALQLAQKACDQTKYKEAYILSTLAAAYAETGDFDAALKWSKKAVELSGDDRKEQLSHELESYKKHKPWRERQTEQQTDSSQEQGKSKDKSPAPAAAGTRI